MSSKRVIMPLVLTVICALSAPCATLSNLLQTSDVVVLGTVSSRRVVGPEITFEIQVDRAMKGDVREGALVPARWQSVSERKRLEAAGEVKETVSGVWFLKYDTDGTLLCLPANSPGSQVRFHAVPFPAAKGNVAADLESLRDGSLEFELLTQIVAGFEERPDNPRVFLNAIGNLDSPKLRAIFDRFSRSSSQKLKAAGLAALIMRGDSDAALRCLTQIRGFSNQELPILFGSFWSQYRNPDPKVIKLLGQIATGSGPDLLRPAAIMVLRSVHTRETLPFLAALLDHPNPERQVDGVFGLSSFANGFGMAQPDNVRTMQWLKRSASGYRNSETERHQMLLLDAPEAQRREFVRFWRNWWADHRQELTN